MSKKSDKVDLDFKSYTKTGIHSSIKYPGTMIAPMQNKLIDKILCVEEINSVLDPFVGSGTTLYEINNKIDRLEGIDINPYSNLITRTKLNGVTKSIDKSIKQLKQNIEFNKNENLDHYFINIDKWFREDIKEDLIILRESIIDINSKRDRDFFWCMFGEIIKKYSNSRNTTFKLHIEKEEIIINKKNDVIKDFLKKVEKDKVYFKKHLKKSNYRLYVDDVKKIVPRFKENEFDMVITSPPYGDNPTTITYGQYSMLPLYWIDKKDLIINKNQLDNYSMIDNLSLGGNKLGTKKDYSHYFKDVLKKIEEDKKKKVRNFLNDYLDVLEGLSNITNKYMVLTLGNRTVSGININLTQITFEFLEKNNFIIEEILERNITNKVMPSKILTKKGKEISLMNKEYVLIAKKE